MEEGLEKLKKKRFRIVINFYMQNSSKLEYTNVCVCVCVYIYIYIYIYIYTHTYKL